jgi:hypothetical protein
MRAPSVCGLASVALAAGVAAWAAGPFGEADALARRLEAIKQPPELTRWQQIPWMTSLTEGLRVARQENRPLFLWASADDPLDRC